MIESCHINVGHSKTMGPSSGLRPFVPHTLSIFATAPILDMSVIIGVDLEAGLLSEKSKSRGAGIVGTCLGLSWDVRRSLLIRNDITR